MVGRYKIMKRIIIITICCLLFIVGCTNKSNNDYSNNNVVNDSTIENNEDGENVIKVIISDKTYTLNLENNKTVEEFINLLPKEFTMNELNGNEKYVNMNDSLTTNSYKAKHIEKGDVMLYGDNCLVIFYKSFDTPYQYTKIGHIDNLDDLGNGSIKVKFEK